MSVADYTDLFIPTKTSITDKLAETAAKIAFTNFEWRYITLLFFNSTSFGVIDFLQLFDKSVMISTGLTQLVNADNTDQFVIFGQDVPDITSMLDWLEHQEFDNTGRYIVICESDQSENCDENEAVSTFWFHKITNVIFLKHLEGNVIPYTYYYNENTCAMSEPIEMKDFDLCLSNTNECDMYPDKFRNLHGCPLIVSTFEQPPYMTLLGENPKGIDGDLLLIIAEALNSTLQVMTPYRGDGWGALGDNGTWFGSLGDIYYDFANISITSAALTLNRFSSFQFSYNYNFIKIGWVTSPTELESSSLKLLHPFSMLTHIAVDIIFIFVIVIALLVRSKLWTKYMIRPDADSQTVLLYSWMLCMGSPMKRLTRKRFFLYITLLWIWYTFFVRTMYQAALINSLKSNTYVTNIETVEQAIEAKYRITGGHALKDYFINYPLVYNQFVGINATEIYTVINKISEGDKILVAINLELVHSLLKKHNVTLHTVSQKIVVSPTAIFFKKFSPLADPIDLVLQRLSEAGFPYKLYKNYAHPHNKTPKSVDDKKPLQTKHYQGCYAILFLGWTVSIVYFLCEMCVGARHNLYIL